MSKELAPLFQSLESEWKVLQTTQSLKDYLHTFNILLICYTAYDTYSRYLDTESLIHLSDILLTMTLCVTVAGLAYAENLTTVRLHQNKSNIANVIATLQENQTRKGIGQSVENTDSE